MPDTFAIVAVGKLPAYGVPEGEIKATPGDPALVITIVEKSHVTPLPELPGLVSELVSTLRIDKVSPITGIKLEPHWGFDEFCVPVGLELLLQPKYKMEQQIVEQSKIFNAVIFLII